MSINIKKNIHFEICTIKIRIVPKTNSPRVILTTKTELYL